MVSMDRSARFWDKIAERYAQRPVADEAVYQKKLQLTREYFTPEMTLLELGCGTGSTALTHAPLVKQIRATDISARMLAIAQAKARAQGITNVRFERASVSELVVADASLDMVLALNLLHLLPDMTAVIAQIERMLKPGGLFISSTICLGDGMRWLGLIAPLGQRLGLMPALNIFRASELEQALMAAGFDIEQRWLPGKNQALFIVARKAG